MWSRSELKSRAKQVLSGSYWKAFLISLVLILISGGSGGSSGRSGANAFGGHNWEFSFVLIPIIIGIFFTVLAIGLAIKVFLEYPLQVGGRRYFVRAAEGEVRLNYLGYAFNGQYYMSVVKAMLYKGVLVLLWTLLFVFPGIIKAYAYSMVPYILSNNPNMDHKRALELSNQMTNGEKLDMFVLDLSFIGWFILGALALGIGVFFVWPYYFSTRAELYLKLRQKALDKGLCSYAELNMNHI